MWFFCTLHGKIGNYQNVFEIGTYNMHHVKLYNLPQYKNINKNHDRLGVCIFFTAKSWQFSN